MYPVDGLEPCTDPKPGDILVCGYNFPSNIVQVTSVSEIAVWGHWGREVRPVTPGEMPLSMGRSNKFYYYKKPKREPSGFGRFIVEKSL